MGYPIMLDRERNFKYGFRALDSLEKKLKKPIGAAINLNALSMTELATVIWAGLIHEDKKLTVDQVMDLVDDYSNLPTVTKAMEKSLEDAFGGSDGDEKNETAAKNLA